MAKKKSKECEVLLTDMEDLINQYNNKEISNEYYITKLSKIINSLETNHKQEMTLQEKTNLKFLKSSMIIVKKMLNMQNKMMNKK